MMMAVFLGNQRSGGITSSVLMQQVSDCNSPSHGR